jgi:hypothetical protein
MSTLKNQIKSTAAAAAFSFLALAGAAQAGIVIVDEPTTPRTRVAAVTYPACQDTGFDFRTMPLQRRAEGADAGVTVPVRPAPAATPIPAATPVPVQRAPRAHALALVVGVAY